jgi:hypothetical protein
MGVYVMTEEEREAIAKSRQGQFASEDEVDAYWQRHGVA